MASSFIIHDDTSIIAPTLNMLKETFNSGKTFSLAYREQQLNNLIKGFLEMQPVIAEAYNKDHGLSEWNNIYLSTGFLIGELNTTLQNFKLWAKKRPYDTPLMAGPGTSYIKPEPYGVMLIYGSWNYPFRVTLPYAASAIAAGNCVVIKPSEIAPNCSRALAQLFENYLDKDCYRVIEGGGNMATELSKQQWDLIIFTGSTDKGRKVAAAAGANLVPIILELGGKNPAIVDKDADLEVAAKRIAHTKMLNWGATCVSPDYVIAHECIKDQLIINLKNALIEFYTEKSIESDDRVKIINDSEFERIKSYLDENHGGKVVFGGGFDKSKMHIEPTIIDSPKLDSKLIQNEIFGPVLPVISFKNINEAIKLVNSKPKPLALYYFGSLSNPNKDLVIQRTSSGGVNVNDCTFHGVNSNLPFGGVGESGYGVLHGKSGFESCSHLKSVLERKTWDFYPWNVRYPPYTPAKQASFMRAYALFGSWTQEQVVKKLFFVSMISLSFLAYKIGYAKGIIRHLRVILSNITQSIKKIMNNNN